LVFRQLPHVLLEDLLVLGREVVDRPLAVEHGLAEPGRQVAPVPRAVHVAPELGDGIAGAVGIVGLGRGTAGLLLRLRLTGLRLVGLPRPGLLLTVGSAAASSTL